MHIFAVFLLFISSISGLILLKRGVIVKFPANRRWNKFPTLALFMNARKDLPPSLKSFQQHAYDGIACVLEGRIHDAFSAFNLAATFNSSQPLPQRGILAYCTGDFQAAIEQLSRDVFALEKPRMVKATDLRLWLAAAHQHLGNTEGMRAAIDPENNLRLPISTQSRMMNLTSEFFLGEVPLEDLLMYIVESSSHDDSDFMGHNFYGNLYIGLFYDSKKELDLAQAFLAFPASSRRYGPRDMWHHIPRVLYRYRFHRPASHSDDSSSDPLLQEIMQYDIGERQAERSVVRKSSVNSAGMII